MGEEVVFIGIGSNQGDRIENVKEALKKIEQKFKLLKASSLYLSQPVGMKRGTPWFINCVVEVKTKEKPEEILSFLEEVEKEMGRERKGKFFPRPIDLDLLLYGKKVIEKPPLTIPHPRMHKRRFVLLPLVEIEEKAYHPSLRKTARELLMGLEDEWIVEKLEEEE